MVKRTIDEDADEESATPTSHRDQLYLRWSKKRAIFDGVEDRYRALVDELNDIGRELQQEYQITVPLVGQLAHAAPVAMQPRQAVPLGQPFTAIPPAAQQQLAALELAGAQPIDLPMLDDAQLAAIATQQQLVAQQAEMQTLGAINLPSQHPITTMPARPDPTVAELQQGMVGGVDGMAFLANIGARFQGFQNLLDH